MKNKVKIEICDKEYVLVTEESEDYVYSLAKQINQMIDDSVFNNFRSSKIDAAVLTCLDLCDKNNKLTESNDNMRGQITVYIDEIAQLNKKLLKLERQKAQTQKEKTPASVTVSEAEDKAQLTLGDIN